MPEAGRLAAAVPDAGRLAAAAPDAGRLAAAVPEAGRLVAAALEVGRLVVAVLEAVRLAAVLAAAAAVVVVAGTFYSALGQQMFGHIALCHHLTVGLRTFAAFVHWLRQTRHWKVEVVRERTDRFAVACLNDGLRPPAVADVAAVTDFDAPAAATPAFAATPVPADPAQPPLADLSDHQP